MNTKLKTIKLDPVSVRRPDISAASSLINFQNRVFVCCDDQYVLFELKSGQDWIQHCWTEAPHLPENHEERKKLKPDFEALLSSELDNNKILLIPSGSKSNRTKALEFDLSSNQFSLFDMSDFYKNLSIELPNINIEGAAAYEGNYLFLNRGIKSELSSIVNVDSKSFKINSITQIDFGPIGNIHFHGSELCIFQNNLFAVAVAEASENSYDDGEVLGSSFFKICLNTFTILDQWIFDKTIKVEGLCRWQDKWLVATDPDGNGCSEFFTFDL